MRYTTIIDIRDLPQIWNNQNCARAYLFLCLASGYHDADRDLVKVSVRGLAALTGLSVAASRHALTQLQKAGLITRQGDTWRVVKFVITETPAARPKTKREQQLEIERLKRQQEEKEYQAKAARKQQLEAAWSKAITKAEVLMGAAVKDLSCSFPIDGNGMYLIAVKSADAAAIISRKDFLNLLSSYFPQDVKFYPRKFY